MGCSKRSAQGGQQVANSKSLGSSWGGAHSSACQQKPFHVLSLTVNKH